MNPAFIINNKKLYTEKILVEFQIPLLFTCKDEDNNKYIVECFDEDKMEYIISDTTNKDILDMLNKRCTMYELMKRGSKHWICYAGQNLDLDKIEEVNEFTDDQLPVKDAYYEYPSKGVLEYMKELEK